MQAAADSVHWSLTPVVRLSTQRFYCQGRPPQPCLSHHIVWPGYPLPPKQVFDFQLNHFTGNGQLKKPFGHVLAWYKACDACVAARLSHK